MLMKYPKTTKEFRVVKIDGKNEFKVLRITYVQQTIDERTKRITSRKTVLKHVGKSEAEEYVFKIDRGIK